MDQQLLEPPREATSEAKEEAQEATTTSTEQFQGDKEGRDEGEGDEEEGGYEGDKEDMEAIVRRLGLVELKRTEEEVQRVVERLVRANWVTSLAQWRALPPAKKHELQLPLMLRHRLDELAAASSSTSRQKDTTIEQGLGPLYQCIHFLFLFN